MRIIPVLNVSFLGILAVSAALRLANATICGSSIHANVFASSFNSSGPKFVADGGRVPVSLPRRHHYAALAHRLDREVGVIDEIRCMRASQPHTGVVHPWSTRVAHFP